MPAYSWLLFDADGTLFDFDRAEARALEMVLADLGRSASAACLESYRRMNRSLWRAFELGRISQDEIKVKRFELWLGEMGIAADASAVGRDYALRLSEQRDLLADAHEVVEELARRYRLLIITNGLSEVQRPRFERSSLRPFLQDIVVSGEVGAAKPEAGIFDAAFARMGAPARREVLMIGDSLTADVTGAIRYGIDACWCNFRGERTELPVKHTVTRLTGLLDFL